MERGVERRTKAKRRPKKAKVDPALEHESPEWAEQEIQLCEEKERTGHSYLEKQLEKAIEADGNSAEVLRLLKYFKERREHAVHVQGRHMGSRTAPEVAPADRERYRLDHLGADAE